MQIKLPNAIMSVEKMYSEALSQSDGKYLLSILPFSIEGSFAGFYSHSPQLYSWIAEFRFQVEPLFPCQTHVMAMWRGHLPDCFGLIQWSSSVFQVPHFANQSRIRSHSVEWITRIQTEYTQHQYFKNPELIETRTTNISYLLCRAIFLRLEVMLKSNIWFTHPSHAGFNVEVPLGRRKEGKLEPWLLAINYFCLDYNGWNCDHKSFVIFSYCVERLSEKASKAMYCEWVFFWKIASLLVCKMLEQRTSWLSPLIVKPHVRLLWKRGLSIIRQKKSGRITVYA